LCDLFCGSEINTGNKVYHKIIFSVKILHHRVLTLHMIIQYCMFYFILIL